MESYDEHSKKNGDKQDRMPFINVTSKGGQFDDRSFMAGYEMGILDMSLVVTGHYMVEMIIHSENELQADLIAMRHDWQMEVLERDEGYSFTRFTKNVPVIGERFLLEKEFDDGED